MLSGSVDACVTRRAYVHAWDAHPLRRCTHSQHSTCLKYRSLKLNAVPLNRSAPVAMQLRCQRRWRWHPHGQLGRRTRPPREPLPTSTRQEMALRSDTGQAARYTESMAASWLHRGCMRQPGAHALWALGAGSRELTCDREALGVRDAFVVKVRVQREWCHLLGIGCLSRRLGLRRRRWRQAGRRQWHSGRWR